MPPTSSQRRARARKPAEPAERSDAEDQDAANTPTRKRKRAIDNTPTPVKTETNNAAPRNEGGVTRRKRQRAGEIKVFEDETITHEEMDDVFPNLKMAKYRVQARIDHADEIHEAQHPEGKQAFAKIAGNGWTFYVDQLEVRIGRPPDERPEDVHDPQGAASGAVAAATNADADKSLVHIDLGPSKLVSRQHAEIRFNETDGRWCITVNGRNGVKLDEEPLGRGMTGVLRCGSVMDIAGTQMMFVTPNENPIIHPMIMAQLRPFNDDSRDDEDDEEEEADQFNPNANTNTHTAPQRTPARGSALPRGGAQQRSSVAKDGQGRGHANHEHQAAMTSSVGRNHSSVDSHDLRPPSSQAGSKPSPTYSRGLMLESTEDIDYSQDSAKDLKPPHSYAQLIGMAIMNSSEEKLTLSKIYDFIKERYAFYRFSGGGWQNSIRHNLSLNKCFEKVARRTDEPGKGMKWQIVAEHRNEFFKKGLNSAKKVSGRGSSGPNSPLKASPSLSGKEKIYIDKAVEDPFVRHPEADREVHKFLKSSPRSMSPPIGAYPQRSHAFTPDRRGYFFNGLPGTSPRNEIGTSPFPDRSLDRDRKPFTEAAAAGTPGGPALLGGNEYHDRLVTPLISRQMPKLAPPSTAHLPSQFVAMSSPAPFWKYAAEFASSPAKGFNLSPVKLEKTEGSPVDEEDEDMKDSKPLLSPPPKVQSSSPAPAEGDLGQESPTKALSGRVRESKDLKPQSRPTPPLYETSGSQVQSQYQAAPAYSAKLDQSVHSKTTFGRARDVEVDEDEDDDDEEEGGLIDLAKGFQTIGAFHSNLSAHTAGMIRGN